MENEGQAHKGFAILSAAGILNKVLSVIYIPVLFQIVGELGYGIYSAGYKIYAFIYILTNAGFPIGIAKLEAEFLARKNHRDAVRSFKVILLVLAAYGFAMTALTVIFARSLTMAISNPDSFLVILALSPTIFFSAVSSSFRGFFNGRMDMKPTAVSQILEQCLNVFLSLGFAFILKPYGIVAACAGATVGTTLGSLGSAFYLWAKYRQKAPGFETSAPPESELISNRDIVRRFLFYAVPIAINSIIIFGTDLVDLANTSSRLLAAGLSSEAATIQFGILNKYTSLLNVPVAVTTALYVAMMPYFSAAIAVRDDKRLKSSVGEAFRLSLLISVPSAVGLAVLAKPIFGVIFARSSEGWRLMAYGSIVVILYSIVQIQAGILQALNKTQYSTYSLLAGIAVKIAINNYLIAMPSINVMGAVIGTIACYAIAIAINLIFLKRFLPVKAKVLRYLPRPLVSSALMGAAALGSYKLGYFLFRHAMGLYLSNAVSTFIAVFTGVAVYTIVIIRMRGVSAEEIGEMPYGKKILAGLKKSHLI
ncbi:MAG: polysaccharide biosynthesis protein [Spirochaetes bacterium]|nr:polysaccharide biosynthesis protein [Spirochaetota bacterium]